MVSQIWYFGWGEKNNEKTLTFSCKCNIYLVHLYIFWKEQENLIKRGHTASISDKIKTGTFNEMVQIH